MSIRCENNIMLFRTLFSYTKSYICWVKPENKAKGRLLFGEFSRILEAFAILRLIFSVRFFSGINVLIFWYPWYALRVLCTNCLSSSIPVQAFFHENVTRLKRGTYCHSNWPSKAMTSEYLCLERLISLFSMLHYLLVCNFCCEQ